MSRVPQDIHVQPQKIETVSTTQSRDVKTLTGSNSSDSIHELQSVAVFTLNGDSESKAKNFIVAYGREPQGPHIWILTGKLRLSLRKSNPSSEDSLSSQGNKKFHKLSYYLDLNLFVVRSFDSPSWKEFSLINNEPLWFRMQARQNSPIKTSSNENNNEDNTSEGNANNATKQKRVNKYLYNLSPVQGAMLIGEEKLHSAYIQSLYQTNTNETSNEKLDQIELDFQLLEIQEQKYLLSLFRDKFQSRITTNWNEAGLFLWFHGGAFAGSALYISLIDYSYRQIDRDILIVPQNTNTSGQKDIYLLNRHDTFYQLSRIPFSEDNPLLEETDFKVRVDEDYIKTYNHGKKNLKLALQNLNDNRVFLRIGQRSWLLTREGDVLWDSHQREIYAKLQKQFSFDSDRVLLLFESQDFFHLSPQSERLTFFKIFLDKYEIGRTEPTIGSRLKIFKKEVKAGRHLIMAERWELFEKSYKRVKNILQPMPVYFTSEPGGIIRLKLNYQGGQKAQIQVEKLKK